VWDTLTVSIHLEMIRIMKDIPPESQQIWLKLLEMDRFDANCPHELSSGMKRKLSFMMSSIFNPMYKFLDEPTTGLDPIARKRCREIIDFQKQIYGGSTVFTTHAMNEAEKSCDRILLLIGGNTVFLDTIENLKRTTGGFNLTIIKNSPYDLGRELLPKLNSIFSREFSESAIIEENEYKVKIGVEEPKNIGTIF
jgi:ABC-type multidrug transport system ATPase subunit